VIANSSTHLPQRKVALAIADAVLVAGALVLAVAIRLGPTAWLVELGGHTVTLVLLWLVLFPCFYLFGLYDTERLETARSLLLPALGGATVAGLLGAVALRVALPAPQAHAVGILVAALVFGAILLVRLVHSLAARRGYLSSRALVVGTLAQAREISDLLERHPHSGFRIVGMVALGREEERRHQVLAPYARLGEVTELEQLVEANRIDHVLLGAGLERDLDVLRRLRPVRYRGAAVLDFVTLYERLAHEITIAHIDDVWLFAAAMNSSRFHAKWLKRALDVLASLLLLVPAALLLLPLAALAIKLTSKGPVLFRQERLGLGARPFMLLKLRTMRADAEALTGPVWSADNDPRITPTGRILRKYRVDELPQLWNVLVGDMSMIGPRPERDVFVRELSAKLPLFSERLLVRPGITGWAQVMAPYASSVSDSFRKLQYDLYYAKHMSLFLDALILVKTVKTMLLGRERHQGGLAAGKQLASRLETANVPRAAITVGSIDRGAEVVDPVALSQVG
jgi:exopolysaccharide biosynthesis polyprenyl glycosylphosphotransferase